MIDVDWASIRDAAKRGLKPGKPLQERPALLRVAIGMAVITAVGASLGDPVKQLLLTIGGFLSTLAALMPHERSRMFASIANCVGMLVALIVGLAVGPRWGIVLPVLFVAFFVCGMFRAVEMAFSVRGLLVTITFLAFAEMSQTLPVGHVEVFAYFALGCGIQMLCQLLPPYGAQHSAQRRAVSGLYRALSTGVGISPALLAADRSLALLRFRNHTELDRLTHLVERGESVGQLLLALDTWPDADTAAWRTAASDQLAKIAVCVAQPVRRKATLTPAEWPGHPTTPILEALVATLDGISRLAARVEDPDPTDDRLGATSFELIRDEFHPGSPVFQHALRLAVTGVIGQVVGLLMGDWLGSKDMLAGHGFWVVVAAALIVFPDYGSTFARGISRTIGTIAGAALGIVLSFLPFTPELRTPVLHGILLFVLYCGYLVFRSCGQAYTMFWVVTWISCMTVGPLGATTRGVATVVGCLLAFLAYVLAPTWQRRMITERIHDWAHALAGRLDALIAYWNEGSDRHRHQVARSTVNSRLALIDFIETATSAQLEPADPHGRWPNRAIDPAINSVLEASRQVSLLHALAPFWDDAERARVSEETAALADRLRGLPHAFLQHVQNAPAAESDAPRAASELDVVAAGLPTAENALGYTRSVIEQLTGQVAEATAGTHRRPVVDRGRASRA